MCLLYDRFSRDCIDKETGEELHYRKLEPKSTGLHLAALVGDERSIGAGLRHGIDPDPRYFVERTPLMHVAANGHILAAKVLAYGADPDHSDWDKATPLLVAAKQGQESLVELL